MRLARPVLNNVEGWEGTHWSQKQGKVKNLFMELA